MSRTAKFVTFALIILWLSGMHAGEGEWRISILELTIFFLIMHVAHGSKE